MAFDAKEYRNRVLSQYARSKEPILRKALGELKQNPQLQVPTQFDLAEFYDVPANPSDDALAAQIDSVASAIKAAVQKPGGTRQPLELHELIVARNPNLKTSSFWAEVLQRRAQQAQAALSEFGKNAAADFSSLGVVTSKQLRELAKGSSVSESVSDADLARVVEAEGVSVVAELPPVNAPAQVLKEIANGLKKTSARSVLSAIFLKAGEPRSFTILDGYRPSEGSSALSVTTVAEAYNYTQSLPDTDENDAYQKILAAIKNAAKSDAELSGIVVAHFIELGRKTFKEVGTKRGALKAFTDRTGIDPKDAGRVLLQVAPAGAAQQRGYSDVQSLIAAGSLKEARRLYGVIFAESSGSESDAQKQALAALEGTERRVAELRKRAESSQTQGDPEAAAKALNEALTICNDDEALAAAARALPPAAPARFVAAISEDGRKTRLSWEPGFGSTDDVRYQLIRKIGAPPRNNTDGTPVGRAIQSNAAEDPAPPVAVRLFYGVSASRGGGASPVAIAEAMSLPPVTDVVVSSDPSSVTLRWTAPPEASSIEIVQAAPDGSTTTLQPGTQSGTTSRGLRTGATYTYLLTAVYTGRCGDRLRSETVRVTGVPRGTAAPVPSLAVSAQPATGSKSAVSAEWPRVEGYPVEVWHYAQKPNWLAGTRITMAQVRSQGVQLAGRALASDGREGVHGSTEQGLRYYVAITRDGDTGLVGAMQPYGSAPPVQNVRADRFGDEVVLSWDWPGPEYEVRVRWDGASNGERFIAMNEYRTEGGCRVPMGAGGGVARVASVAGEGDARWVSSETPVTIGGATTPVEYDVNFHKKLLGPPSGATLRFSNVENASPIEIVVVGHFSKFMPFDASQGSVLTRTTVTATDPQVDVSLPRGGKGTVWIRAFATTPGIRLVDPPPTRMRVG